MKAASTKQKAHLDSPDSITATASGEISPAECPPPATTHLNTARGSLLVRVLNRNLAQQQQESSLQSLSSDPLLNALPAGSPLSHPSSATARMVAEQAWLASESHTPDRPESDPTGDDRSPVTPASTLFSSPDSPTTVLLRAAGASAASATAPPPPTPVSSSEPCTPYEPVDQVQRAASTGDILQAQSSTVSIQNPALGVSGKPWLESWPGSIDAH